MIPQTPLFIKTLVIGILVVCPLSAQEIPSAVPEDVGMSSGKLAEIDPIMEGLVRERKLAGAVVMVTRRGKIVHFQSYGKMDLESQKPMRKDTILRFYSMTKSITTAAAMILVDQGKLDLDAPVSRYLPEFEDLWVYGKKKNTRTQNPMTVRDLMRHTAGLIYGSRQNRVAKLYREADVMNREEDLEQMTAKLGKLPLLYDPGTDWAYSVSVDVLGRVVEVVSGEPLDRFLDENLFGPLDMKDTGFWVPSGKRDRFAANYLSDRKGNLTLKDAPGTSRYLAEPKLLSGGGGLVSTARDYMRFLMMIANGGKLFGKRVLSAKATRMMTTNQLPKEVEWIKFGDRVRRGVGFGLGFSVREKLSDWDPAGRVGEYGWGGAASTHYWVSPKDNLIVITLEQTMPYSFMTEFALKGIIYGAIEE